MSRSPNRAGQAFVGVVVGLLLASVPAPASAQEPPNYYVLCIGINKYENPDIKGLRGAVNDANAIEEMFKGQGSRVRVRKLLDEEAATQKIQDALKTMVEEVEPGEIVVVYLSGHGGRDMGLWNFVPYDYKVRGFGLNDFTFLFPINTLIHRGHRVLFVVDACNAGEIGHNGIVAENLEGIKSIQAAGDAFYRGGLILLAACTPSQTSKDGVDNGMFTKALLEALRGRADVDRDGIVTLKEVRTYLFLRVRDLERKQSKYPGMAWPADQDYICVSSQSIPETFVMAKVAGGKPLLRLEEHGFWRPLGFYVASGPNPVGVWREVKTLTRSDGSPLLDANGRPAQHIYELVLRENQTYTASLTDSDGIEETTVTTNGRYTYRPGSYTLHDNNADILGLRVKPDFTLRFANGYDDLKLESLTEDEMLIEAYPGPSVQPPQTYRLSRVKASPVPR